MMIGGHFMRWDKQESETAARVYREMVSQGAVRKEAVAAIARALRTRTHDAVCHHLSEYGPTFDGPSARQRLLAEQPWRRKRWPRRRGPNRGVGGGLTRETVPEQTMAERNHRINVEHDSLTAEMCGDPKPGYSALDRKQQIATLPQRPKISAVVRS